MKCFSSEIIDCKSRSRLILTAEPGRGGKELASRSNVSGGFSLVEEPTDL